MCENIGSETIDQPSSLPPTNDNAKNRLTVLDISRLETEDRLNIVRLETENILNKLNLSEADIRKIYSNNEVIDSELIFKRFYNVLNDCTDLTYFGSMINNSVNISLSFDKTLVAIDFAPKMILGLLLRGFKNRVEEYNSTHKDNKLSYVSLTEKIVGNRISRDQRILWMKASEIIDYDGMEKFYPLGITLIEKLVRLLQSGQLTNDKVMPLINKLERAGVKFDEKYENFLEITKNILYYIDNFEKNGTNFELYIKVMKSRYRITKDDVNMISNRYKDIPDIGNLYFSKLIELGYCKKSVIKYFDQFINNQKSCPNKGYKNNAAAVDSFLDEMLCVTDHTKNINNTADDTKNVDNTTDGTKSIDNNTADDTININNPTNDTINIDDNITDDTQESSSTSEKNISNEDQSIDNNLIKQSLNLGEDDLKECNPTDLNVNISCDDTPIGTIQPENTNSIDNNLNRENQNNISSTSLNKNNSTVITRPTQDRKLSLTGLLSSLKSLLESDNDIDLSDQNSRDRILSDEVIKLLKSKY